MFTRPEPIFIADTAQLTASLSQQLHSYRGLRFLLTITVERVARKCDLPYSHQNVYVAYETDS